MMDYSFLFEDTPRATHCVGKDNTPPIHSASNDVVCTENGCPSYAHHRCASDKHLRETGEHVSVVFCECPKNTERDINHRRILHYFKRTDCNHNLICPGCQQNCGGF